MEEKIYFISGHINLEEAEFQEHYVPKINEALESNSSFVIGDCNGADTMAQNYLFGKTENVTIYHMYNNPRNNAGFPTKGGHISDDDRDEQMTLDSTHDIAWSKREGSGTEKNIKRREEITVTCGCGRPTRYFCRKDNITHHSCSKYFRCQSRNQLARTCQELNLKNQELENEIKKIKDSFKVLKEFIK